MTANEMADELELRLDRGFSYGSPGYEDFELSSVLTQAQHHYFKSFYSKKNNRKGYGFEETEVRNQGMSELIKYSLCPVSSNQVGIIKNGIFYDLPEDFMYTIYEEVTLDKKDCDEYFIIADVDPVSHSEIRRLTGNKYKKPKVDSLQSKVLRMQFSRELNLSTSTPTDKRHQLITDGEFNVTEYRINYLMNIPEINVDMSVVSSQKNCIFDISTHDIVIDTARDILLGIVKEQKVPTEVDMKDLE